VEEGSKLLKEVLAKWKEGVSEGMPAQEKVELLRSLVKGDERLMGNKFFESVRAL